MKGLNKNSPSQYPTIDIDLSSRINDDDDGDDDVGDVDNILAGEVRQLPDQVAEHMHWAGDSTINDWVGNAMSFNNFFLFTMDVVDSYYKNQIVVKNLRIMVQSTTWSVTSASEPTIEQKVWGGDTLFVC